MGMLLAAGLAPAFRAAAQSRPLICGIMDSPPWVLHDGPQRGIAVDMLEQLSKLSGVPIEVQPGPPARLSMALREGQIDLLAFLRQPTLEPFAVSLGALAKVELGYLTRIGFVPRSEAEFEDRVIGSVRGGGIPGLMDGLPPGPRVDLRDVAQGLVMMLGGRLDAVLGSRMGIEWHIRQSGLHRSQFGTFLAVKAEPILMYASRTRSLPDDAASRLSRALPKVEAGRRLLEKPYLADRSAGQAIPDKAPPAPQPRSR